MTAMTDDAIDIAGREWAQAYPRLDVGPGEVLARVSRLGHLIETAQNRRLRRRPGMFVSNVGDFDVLRALRRVGPPYTLTPTQIYQAMLVSPAGLNGRLKRLEHEGWITRRASATDGRSTLVQLTPEGVADLDRDLESHYAFESDLLRQLGADERTEVADQLRRLLLDIETRLSDTP